MSAPVTTPRLTAHAVARARQRIGNRVDPAGAVRLPELPRGVRLLEPDRNTETWLTGSALLICRRIQQRPVAVTVVDLPDGLLAAVLCRLAFGCWLLDETDGVELPDDTSKHVARRLRIRGRRRRW